MLVRMNQIVDVSFTHTASSIGIIAQTCPTQQCNAQWMCNTCCNSSLTKLRHHLEATGSWCSKKMLTTVLPAKYLGQIINKAKYHDGIIHRTISSNDTTHGPEVAAVHITTLQNIAHAATPTLIAGMDKDQAAFVVKHARAAGLWVSPQREVVKLATKYNIYNKETLMHTIHKVGTVGIAAEDVFIEYQNAYIDLNQLITEKQVVHKEGTLWQKQ